MTAGTVLVARLDNAGDVLLQGPLVRAAAAGAASVIVPTPVTRPQEIAAAPQRAPTLTAAVADVLAGSW